MRVRCVATYVRPFLLVRSSVARRLGEEMSRRGRTNLTTRDGVTITISRQRGPNPSNRISFLKLFFFFQRWHLAALSRCVLVQSSFGRRWIISAARVWERDARVLVLVLVRVLWRRVPRRDIPSDLPLGSDLITSFRRISLSFNQELTISRDPLP
jgi:hypothetical protein